MKSLPSSPAIPAAARKSSLGAGSLQPRAAAGAHGTSGSSRAGGRSQVARTSSVQSSSLSRSPLHSSPQEFSPVAPPAAPTRSTILSAASFGSRAPSSSSPADAVASVPGASASLSFFAADGGYASSAATDATPAASRSSLRSARAASAAFVSSSRKQAASAAAVSAPAAPLPAIVEAAARSGSSLAAPSPTRVATVPPSPFTASTSSFASTLSPPAAAETSSPVGTAAAAVSSLSLDGSSPPAGGSSFPLYFFDASSGSSLFPVAAAASSESGDKAVSSTTEQHSPQLSAAATQSPLTSPLSVSATAAATAARASAPASSSRDEGTFFFPFGAADSLSSFSFSSSMSSVEDSSSSRAAKQLASIATQHLLSHDSMSSQTSQFSSQPSSTDQRILHIPSLPPALKEARAHTADTDGLDYSTASSPKMLQGSHPPGRQHLLNAAPTSLIAQRSGSDQQQQQQHEPQEVELLQLMAKARLAASLENWPDVITAMKGVAATQPSLNVSQRVLVIGAYTNQLNERRISRKQLHTRVGALKILQQPPPKETGDSSGSGSSSSSAKEGEEMKQGMQGGGAAAADWGVAVGKEVQERAAAAMSESISLSLSLEDMNSNDKDDEKTTPAERFEEKRVQAANLLGEALIGEQTLTRYAAFFEFMMVHYRQRVAEGMLALLNDMETFVVSLLLPAAESSTASAAYEQLRGDSLRHVAQEFRDLKKYAESLDPHVAQRNDHLRQALEKKSKAAYEEALRHAEEAVQTKVSSFRLGIVNNYAVVLQEMDGGKGIEAAVDYLGNEFQQTVRQMYEVKDEDEYQRVIIVLGLMRDNVEAWCRLEGVNRTAAEALGLQDPGMLSEHVSLSLDSDRFASILSK